MALKIKYQCNKCNKKKNQEELKEIAIPVKVYDDKGHSSHQEKPFWVCDKCYKDYCYIIANHFAYAVSIQDTTVVTEKHNLWDNIADDIITALEQEKGQERAIEIVEEVTDEYF